MLTGRDTGRESTRPVTIGASRVRRPLDHGGSIDPVTVDGNAFTVIAGPCAIESTEQLGAIANGVRAAGAAMLRGGMYKLRSDPNSFQGLGPKAFEMAREVREGTRLPLVSEVTDPRQIDPMLEVVDMFQVGTRNMFNYDLLAELGRAKKPVLLKRGFAARIDEWRKAAEYVTRSGNEDVVLCERGIRTFEDATRNTLDISAVPVLKHSCDFPVLVDPSHAAGHRNLIPALCLAAAAAGADGLLIEVHNQPEEALSDGHQSLGLGAFGDLMLDLKKVLDAVGRPLNLPAPVADEPRKVAATSAAGAR